MLRAPGGSGRFKSPDGLKKSPKRNHFSNFVSSLEIPLDVEQVGDRERKLLGWKWVVGWRVIGAEWCGKVGFEKTANEEYNEKVSVLTLLEWK
ncbi:hypothetical protein TURU_099268 [Turdus rufiventris]|nr:hypothetical protein TURU_099268 [Turdus rufiventris]